MSRKIYHEETVVQFSYVQSERVSEGRKCQVRVSDESFILVPAVGSNQIVTVDFVQELKLFQCVRIYRNSIQEH